MDHWSLVFRAVRGAVVNAAHAHPGWAMPPNAPASIAKRATGTLRGIPPRALAAGWPSARPAPFSDGGVGDRSGSAGSDPERRGRVAAVVRRAPSAALQREIGRMAGDARRAGEDERHRALVDVLRLLAADRSR